MISGSSAFSKTSLNIWKFTVHVLLKPGLKNFEHYFTSVRCVQLYDLQFSSVAQSCPTLCDPVNCSMPGLPVHHQLPEFMQTRVQRITDAIQPSHPLSFLLLLPPIPPSIRAFSNKSTLRMRWPKYWTFSFSFIPSKEISGMISFKMDWLDLLAVQGTLKSLLQYHSLKASILQRSAFFTVSTLTSIHDHWKNHSLD